MRGLLAGLILFPVIAIAVLSVRPGGLRRQLHEVRRRLKLALVLAGVYLGGSAALRLGLGESRSELPIYALAAILAAAFVALSFEREPPPPR